MKKHFATHFIFAATALASQQALALGFGRVVSDAVLGEPLSVTVPVHVEAGERFGLDCVSVVVYYGQNELTPGGVRTRVDPGTSNNDWLVRISTSTPIGEPVVDVALSAGCGERFVRRFTLFANPPLATTPPVVMSSAIAPPATAPAAAKPGPTIAAAAARGEAGTVRLRAGARKGGSMALSDELNAPRHATRHAKAAEVRADNGAMRKPAAVASPAGEGPRLVLDGGYARLKLDMDEPLVPATPVPAASGAQIGLTDLDDPAVRELHALEQSVQAMKRAEQANRDQTTRLQAQLAQAQERGDWFPWMLGALGLAVVAIAALVWRMRQQSRLAHHAWFEESQVGRPSAAPAATPEPAAFSPVPPQVPTSPQGLPPPVADDEIRPEYPTVDLHEPPEPVSHAVVADASATQPLDRTALAGLMAQEAAAPRELSVEELLDLEQQADFFIALGQEDAAVDLLMSHLRSAGGQSPLPYTKLLEIYRRQGDRSAYERTRARFNRRFNAYAPDWDTGPSAGRTLEDYPETIAQIQAAWASPIDAMAVLEGLLFKRDDTSELFDLPAYRDVLVLFSLARDLWLQGGGTTGTQVDVLLPLDDPYGVGGGASGAQISGLELPIAGAPIRDDFKPTALSSALDLEIPNLDDDLPLEHGHVSIDEGVHATLDALGLAPIDPAKTPSSPDWDLGQPSPDDVPTKR